MLRLAFRKKESGIDMKRILIVCCLLCAGCVVINGRSSNWEESQLETTAPGPGDIDLSFENWSKNKIEYDDGSRISIGIFPGMGEMIEIGRVKWNVWDSENWFDFFYYSTVGQCLFLAPTIYSLIISPFDTHPGNDASVYGLLGCHRWNSSSSRYLTERGPTQQLAMASGNTKPAADTFLIGKSGDGTRLYFEYPGSEKLYEEVVLYGAVDVMFTNGNEVVRRFSKSEHVKRALVYRDIAGEDDPVALKQVSHQRECRRLKERVNGVKGKDGFPYIDDALKSDIEKLDDDLNREMASSLPTRENALLEIESARVSVERRVTEAMKRELVRRRVEAEKIKAKQRAKEVVRINKRRSELVSMLKSSKWDDVLAACDVELESNRLDALTEDKQVWLSLKTQAQQGKLVAEKKLKDERRAKEVVRINKRKSEILSLFKNSNWEEALVACNEELDTPNPESTPEDKEIWLPLKQQAENELSKIKEAAEKRASTLAALRQKLAEMKSRKDYYDKLNREQKKGKEFVELLKHRTDPNYDNWDNEFNQGKGKFVVVSGSVVKTGVVSWGNGVYVRLLLDERDCKCDFIVSQEFVSQVEKLVVGSKVTMRGCIASAGDNIRDPATHSASIISEDDLKATADFESSCAELQDEIDRCVSEGRSRPPKE